MPHAVGKAEPPVRSYRGTVPRWVGLIIVTDGHHGVVLNPPEPLQRNSLFCNPCYITQIVIPGEREGEGDVSDTAQLGRGHGG